MLPVSTSYIIECFSASGPDERPCIRFFAALRSFAIRLPPFAAPAVLPALPLRFWAGVPSCLCLSTSEPYWHPRSGWLWCLFVVWLHLA